MRKIFHIVILSFCVCFAFAQRVQKGTAKDKFVVETKVKAYANAIDSMSQLKDSLVNNPNANTRPNAYGMQLYVPTSFYHSTVMQQFGQHEICSNNVNVMTNRLVNSVLSGIYTSQPGLVTQTAGMLEKAGVVRTDMEYNLRSDALLSDKIDSVMLPMGDGFADVNLHVRRPQFWKFSGNGSLQFTQSYFTDNWYQGGDKSYSAMTIVNLKLNYDDRRKMQWENLFELQLGFQTNESDKYHNFKPTSNLMRLTSKFGYKAIKSWYYTAQIRMQTQLVSNYENNSMNKTTSILNPLDIAFSVGIDWKFQALNGRFKGNMYLAPATYDLRYVSNTDLARRYGIDEGCHTLHKFGPSASVNWEWAIFKNVSWNSRFYVISNFKYVNIEWENTFNFTINRYLSSKLFVYPKYDTSSEKYKEKGSTGYFMLKEWLSLGLNYNF